MRVSRGMGCEGKREFPEKNPAASGIVWHMQKSEGDPPGNRTLFLPCGPFCREPLLAFPRGTCSQYRDAGGSECVCACVRVGCERLERKLAKGEQTEENASIDQKESDTLLDAEEYLIPKERTPAASVDEHHYEVPVIVHRERGQATAMGNIHIVINQPEKLPTFCGEATEKVTEFLEQFHAVSEVNAWDDKEKISPAQLAPSPEKPSKTCGQVKHSNSAIKFSNRNEHRPKVKNNRSTQQPAVTDSAIRASEAPSCVLKIEARKQTQSKAESREQQHGERTQAKIVCALCLYSGHKARNCTLPPPPPPPKRQGFEFNTDIAAQFKRYKQKFETRIVKVYISGNNDAVNPPAPFNDLAHAPRRRLNRQTSRRRRQRAKDQHNTNVNRFLFVQ
ncbi:hypothetical protein PR048_002707 [Dryococelus australis]|uniref:Uncharacterized protein n=1 Tax=Dryococelus australis TaxID=614101 RepID=A0ABQ9IKX8_9NEOP|nr:hypothetical protein PR048_002707 [Dryococelus australis]